uniref:Helicase ATP-binding domain-containing protein n=1 Tax=viral metagenome TaxID=1070528 RepID=A0A6C0EN10_9ZZZZ
MLTIHGYQRPKDSSELALKKALTVRPFSIVKPQFQPKYPVYHEDKKYLYLPKHFGIERYGQVPSQRDVPETPEVHWQFAGSIRPAQIPVVNSFLFPEPHDGIISLHTGGGKTVCALYIASRLRVPTLVIIHNSFLRDQWIDRVKAFLPNARIGRVQADVCDVADKDIVIVMLQTLSMKELNVDVFKPIGFVIVDECHHIASEVFVQALPKVTSKYMLGLSATPDRKDKLMYAIHWFLGPLLYKSETGDSVDTKVNVEVYEYQNDDPVFNEIVTSSQGMVSVPIMVNKLTACEDRTAWLCRIIEDVMDTDRQMLVLSDRVQHCEDLLAGLTPELQEKACILSTAVKSDVRTEYCKTKAILIATYSMCREGFDVPTLNTLLMATPRPDIDQIVGRILRVEKKGRVVHPLIVDIVDPQFRRQFGQRNSLYKKREYRVTKMALPSSSTQTAAEGED